MGWQNGVVIHPIKQHTFYLEVEVDEPDTNQRLWIIFLHTSTDERLIKEQWEELIEKRVQWEENWVIRRGFNDVRTLEEKMVGD